MSVCVVVRVETNHNEVLGTKRFDTWVWLCFLLRLPPSDPLVGRVFRLACLCEQCRVSIKGLGSFSEGTPLAIEVKPADGSASFDIKVNHTFNSEQIEWFKAGSALNLMKQGGAS